MTDLIIIYFIILVAMGAACIASEGQCWILDILTVIAFFVAVVIIMVFVV